MSYKESYTQQLRVNFLRYAREAFKLLLYFKRTKRNVYKKK